ncbi:hypothetical protein CHELA1G11_20771 [Hyphomicrobiales bacterium]|nr:hypothetical protein CHELA1G11_20771 [Hyphomicrobiales bacterium]CAH1691855.1 hypothetical protein CHELA1G2_21086 [Hyphomicrobiales bacterium]
MLIYTPYHSKFRVFTPIYTYYIFSTKPKRTNHIELQFTSSFRPFAERHYEQPNSLQGASSQGVNIKI